MINFWFEVLALLWFFLPAVLGNIAPVVVSRIPVLKNWSYPLDGYVTFHGKRLLGDHKTIRGIVTGVIVGAVTAGVQFAIAEHFGFNFEHALSQDFANANPLLLGVLLGFGALAGDSVKSLFKRMRNIPSGQTWFPYDQLDSVIGAAAFSAPYILLTWQQYAIVIIGGLILHVLINAIGYAIGVRKQIM